jgi:glycosyltransferase involved in cell wall biosynthesis
VITRSEDLATRLGAVGIPAERLRPVHNGIDQERFRRIEGRREAVRERLQIPAETPVVLFVGNLLPIKNPVLLLQAHAALRDDALLLLVGGGPMDAELRKLAEELGTARRVRFIGRCKPDEVADLMRAADVLCLPSWNEGVPNVILEAFGCGLPVVASQVGGIAEVHPEKPPFGLLVKVGEREALRAALETVLSGEKDPETISAHASQFTWERTADAYHTILTKSVAD